MEILSLCVIVKDIRDIICPSTSLTLSEVRQKLNQLDPTVAIYVPAMETEAAVHVRFMESGSQHLTKVPGKHERWSVLLVQVAGFEPITLLIKDSITDCFPEIFAKILQNSFFTKHLWQLSETFLQLRNSEKKISFGDHLV